MTHGCILAEHRPRFLPGWYEPAEPRRCRGFVAQKLPAGVCIVMTLVNLRHAGCAGCLRAAVKRCITMMMKRCRLKEKTKKLLLQGNVGAVQAADELHTEEEGQRWMDDLCVQILRWGNRRFLMTLISSSNLESLWVNETTIWVATTVLFCFVLLNFYLNKLRSGSLWSSDQLSRFSALGGKQASVQVPASWFHCRLN